MILTDRRRDKYVPLSEPGVPQAVLQPLASLGITTLEELRDFWTYGDRQLLTDYLGESPVRFASFAPPKGLTRTAAASGPGNVLNLQAAGPTPPLVKRPRGMTLTASHRRQKAVAPALGKSARRQSSKTVSLADRFPRPRDQGQRGTCVAFAALAYLEHLRSDGNPRTRRLSEQFFYWACKEDDGKENEEGTDLGTARRILKQRGACLHKTWPYEPLPVGPTEGQGPAPDGAEVEARQFTAKAHGQKLGDLEPLRKRLEEGKPFVLGVLTFPSWDYPSVADTGEISMPLPGVQADGGHAVCVVGYEMRDGIPGGGAFIFRNSWGEKWARPQGRFGGGYGTLFFEYVRLYGLDALG
jgi:C1A family cysteine protease